MPVPYNIEKKNRSIPWKKLLPLLGIGLVVGGILSFFIRVFFWDRISIQTTAMEPTLKKGTSYFLNKFSGEYAIGDIVVCEKESGSIVARIIGKPGDKISLQNKIVYRNGDEIPETSFPIQFTDKRPALPILLSHRDNKEEVRVGEREFFVLGDNRDEALDSRTLGNIPQDCIKGKISP